MRVASLALLTIMLGACATSADQTASNDQEERVYQTGSTIPRKKSQLPPDVKTVSGESMERTIGASAGIGGPAPAQK